MVHLPIQAVREGVCRATRARPHHPTSLRPEDGRMSRHRVQGLPRERAAKYHRERTNSGTGWQAPRAGTTERYTQGRQGQREGCQRFWEWHCSPLMIGLGEERAWARRSPSFFFWWNRCDEIVCAENWRGNGVGAKAETAED